MCSCWTYRTGEPSFSFSFPQVQPISFQCCSVQRSLFNIREPSRSITLSDIATVTASSSIRTRFIAHRSNQTIQSPQWHAFHSNARVAGLGLVVVIIIGPVGLAVRPLMDSVGQFSIDKRKINSVRFSAPRSARADRFHVDESRWRAFRGGVRCGLGTILKALANRRLVESKIDGSRLSKGGL